MLRQDALRIGRIDLLLERLGDNRALIRRVSLDLIGLPPTPQDVAAFVADTSSDAYEKAVAKLLLSPF